MDDYMVVPLLEPAEYIKRFHRVMVSRRDWLEHIASLPAVPPDIG